MNIFDEDDTSFMIKSPNGPMRVAKSGVSPDFMSQFGQAATPNPNMVAPTPEPVPSYDDEIAKYKNTQSSRSADIEAQAADKQRENLERQIQEKKADLLLNLKAQSGEKVTLPQGKAWTSPAILEGTISNLQNQLGQLPQSKPLQVSGNGGEVGQMNATSLEAEMSGPAQPQEQPSTTQQGLGGMSQYERGLRREADLADKAGVQQAAMYDGFQRQMEQQQKDRAAREAEKEQLFNKQIVDMEEQQSQLAKMQPQDFWADKSTGTRIVAGLSVMLGALGGAMDGTGSNQGADAIDKAVERDLKMQMLRRDNFKEGIEGKKNLYQMRFAQYKDKDMAEQAVRSDMLQGVELQIKKMQAGMAGPQAKAKLDQVLGEVKMKRESANAELAAKYAEKQMDLQKDMAPRYVPAVDAFALDPESAKALRVESGNVKSAQNSIDELLKISKTPNASMNRDLKAKVEVLKGMLTGSLRKTLVGEGAVSESEQKILKAVIRDPTEFFSLNSANETALQTLRAAIDKKFKANAEAQGLTPKAQKQIKTTARQ